MDFEDNWSPAVKYLVALFLASRRSGDRDRCTLMYQGLGIAIENGFSFGIDDARILKREGIAISTSVGKFSPVWDQGYEKAVRLGGSYVAMYEYATKMRPWRHPMVLIPVSYRKNLEVERRENSRLVPGFCVDRRETLEERFFCTSISDDQIVLCRYHMLEPEKRNEKTGLIWSSRVAKRLVMDREQWSVFCEAFEAENA